MSWLFGRQIAIIQLSLRLFDCNLSYYFMDHGSLVTLIRIFDNLSSKNLQCSSFTLQKHYGSITRPLL